MSAVSVLGFLQLLLSLAILCSVMLVRLGGVHPPPLNTADKLYMPTRVVASCCMTAG